MRDNAPDGNSSIIGGTSVSFDVQKTTLQLDYTGKFGKRGATEYWNWGASLYGGNSNRLALLLQNGAFTPSARVSGFVFRGWDVSRRKSTDVRDAFEAASAAVSGFRDTQKTWFDSNLRPDLFAAIRRLPDTDPTKHQTLEAIYTTKIQAGIILVLRAYEQAQKSANPAFKNQFNTIIDLVKAKSAAFDAELSALAAEEEAVRQQYFHFQSLNPVRRFLVYGRVGTAATGFTYAPQINPADIVGSFKDSLFTSPYLEIGGNFYTRGFLIMGLNVGYGRINSLQSIDPAEYKYQRVITGNNGQQLTTETTIKAYDGVPTQYNQFRVKADLIGLIPTGDRGTLALNPYIRFSTTASSQNSWRYGLAGYYFNRKGGFLGGLYAERTLLVTDLNSNTFSVISKGITLGLRASYLLDTVFSTASPR